MDFYGQKHMDLLQTDGRYVNKKTNKKQPQIIYNWDKCTRM